MDYKNLIEEELDRAGEVSLVSPMVVQLDKFRIMPDTEIPQEDFLFRMFGRPCFPRRDISTITGQEKCGKTFFTSMLMACCTEKKVLELERIREEPMKVMWYDTEQSRSSTKGILSDRISQLANNNTDIDTRLFVFNVRACDYQERMDLLVTGIETYKPDMVIIDNVSDLLPSINDAEASIRVIDQLMQLASENNCNITVVIHVNRSGDKRNLRGWLGTEILHKAFDVFYCEQVEKTEVFSVEQTLSRKYRIYDKLYYKIDEKGLPVETCMPNYQPRDTKGQYMTNKPEAYQINSDKTDSFNQKYIIRNASNARQPWEWDIRHLFEDAMGALPSMTLNDLQKKVMELSGIKRQKYYEKVYDLALSQRVVKTSLDRNGRVVVIHIPQ